MTIKKTPTYPEALQRLHRDASANIHKLNDSNKKRVKKHGVKSMITRLRFTVETGRPELSTTIISDHFVQCVRTPVSIIDHQYDWVGTIDDHRLDQDAALKRIEHNEDRAREILS